MFSQLFIKPIDIYPLVLSPKSYSSHQLLLWHSFVLRGASFIPSVNTAPIFFFFLTKIWGWILHSLLKWCNWMACETKLACQLWSLHNLVTYCWNAARFLVKLEGNCWKSEVPCYRKKTIDASFADKTAAAFELSFEMFCACALSGAFSVLISCASKLLSLLAYEWIPQLIFYFMGMFLFVSVESFLYKVIS